jgi:EpsI family protein
MMHSIMYRRAPMLVPAVFAAQVLLVHYAVGKEQPPATPELSHFPVAFKDWVRLREEPLEPEIVHALNADRLLSRTYVQRPAGPLASLFVAWFQSQRGGARQPHSPKVCLPASGWVPEEAGDAKLETAAGTIRVNRYLVANGSERAVVLYWYQTPHGPVASEWFSKLGLLTDSLRYNRTDIALVRVVTWSTRGADPAATKTAVDFARNLYPLLTEQLPH